MSTKTVNDFVQLVNGIQDKEIKLLLLRGLEKDPLKQSIDEHLQIEFFNNKNTCKIEKLAQSGKNSKAISKKGKPIQKTTTSSKALDGFIADKNCYVILKVCRESGGAQDNQIDDVKKFIEHINIGLENKELDSSFLFILDGTYIGTKIRKLDKLIKNKDKMKIICSDDAMPF